MNLELRSSTPEDAIDWEMFAVSADDFEVTTDAYGQVVIEVDHQLQASITEVESRLDTISFEAIASQLNAYALCLCAAHMGPSFLMPWFQEEKESHEDCKECKKRGLAHSHYDKKGKCPKGHQKPKSNTSRLAA